MESKRSVETVMADVRVIKNGDAGSLAAKAAAKF
jgi:hypothetical protein